VRVLRAEVSNPIKCTFAFPYLVLYPERYSRRVKVSGDRYYTPIEQYYLVVRDVGMAPENPRHAEWVNEKISPLEVPRLSAGVTYVFDVHNLYEYASLIYRLATELPYGKIVVVTDYPDRLYEEAMSVFVEIDGDTITVVRLSDLFRAGRLGLEAILPVYALVLDPSLRRVRDVMGEVYGWFGARVVVDARAPGHDVLHEMPLRSSELGSLDPGFATWVERRGELLARSLGQKDARVKIFAEHRVFV